MSVPREVLNCDGADLTFRVAEIKGFVPPEGGRVKRTTSFCDFKSGGSFKRNELSAERGRDNVMKKMYLTCA